MASEDAILQNLAEAGAFQIEKYARMVAVGATIRGDFSSDEFSDLDDLWSFPLAQFDALARLCRKIGEAATPEVMWQQLKLEGFDMAPLSLLQRLALDIYGKVFCILLAHEKAMAAFAREIQTDPLPAIVPIEDTTLEPVDGFFEKTF